MAERRMLAAIVFTDIVGYTRLMNEKEALAMESLKVHNKVFDELAFKFSGLVVKSIGDSYLIEFPSAVNAVQCALEAQDAFEKRNVDLPDNYKLKVRVSIHVGDVIVDDDDVYGDGVNIASRLQGVTPGGAICLSREAYAQIKPRFGKRFVSLGAMTLKGVGEPVEVFINAESAPEVDRSAPRPAALNVVVPDAPIQVAPERPGVEAAPARPLGDEERRTIAAAKPPPEPPPAPLVGPPGPTPATWAIFAGLYLLFFGRPWLSAGHADWLGAGWASGLVALALCASRRRSPATRGLGAVLVLSAGAAFYMLGAGLPFSSLEAGLAAGVGVVASAAAVYLAFIDPQPERTLAASLLASALALLFIGGAARLLPEGISWTSGLSRYVVAQVQELAASGGGWRWGGVIALYAGWRLAGLSSFDPADWSRSVGADGRKLNWNR